MSVRRGVEVNHSASIISGGLALVSGVIAVGASGFYSVPALVLGVLGLGGIAIGVFGLDHRGVVTVGSFMIFLCVLISGVEGNTPGLLLVSMIGTILSLDLGQNAVSVGRQLSTDTFTRRGEFVHAAASTVVGALVGGVAYGIYFVAEDGQPAPALVFLVLAALLLVWSFRT
jgi:hypothetical protein